MKRFLLPILLMVFGVLFLLGGAPFASNLISTSVMIIGIALVVFGILAIIAKTIALGIIGIVVGVLVASCSWSLAWVALIVLGVLLMVYAIEAIFTHHGSLFFNIIDIVAGVLILMMACGDHFAWSFANVFFYVGGALLIINGICMLVKNH